MLEIKNAIRDYQRYPKAGPMFNTYFDVFVFAGSSLE
jgi:hypothetical protein